MELNAAPLVQLELDVQIQSGGISKRVDVLNVENEYAAPVRAHRAEKHVPGSQNEVRERPRDKSIRCGAVGNGGASAAMRAAIVGVECEHSIGGDGGSREVTPIKGEGKPEINREHAVVSTLNEVEKIPLPEHDGVQWHLNELVDG